MDGIIHIHRKFKIDEKYEIANDQWVCDVRCESAAIAYGRKCSTGRN